MNVTLPPKVARFVRARIKSGMYGSAAEVISTAVNSLAKDEAFGDFAPGELNALLAEGEKDIAEGNVVEGKEAFASIRRIGKARRDGSR